MAGHSRYAIIIFHLFHASNHSNMRISLFSDIHANLPALGSVLADIDMKQSDTVYCLGFGMGMDFQIRLSWSCLKMWVISGGRNYPH